MFPDCPRNNLGAKDQSVYPASYGREEREERGGEGMRRESGVLTDWERGKTEPQHELCAFFTKWTLGVQFG